MPETRSAHPYFLYDAIVAQPNLIEQVFLEIARRDRAGGAGRRRAQAHRLHRHRNLAQRGKCSRAVDAPSFGRTRPGARRAIVRICALSARARRRRCRRRSSLTRARLRSRSKRCARLEPWARSPSRSRVNFPAKEFSARICASKLANRKWPSRTRKATRPLWQLSRLVLGVLEKRGLLKDGASARTALEKVPALMHEALKTEAKTRDAAALDRRTPAYRLLRRRNLLGHCVRGRAENQRDQLHRRRGL